MDGQTGIIILYILIGFFVLSIITTGLGFLIMYRRRKLIFTKFLTKTGQWISKSWFPNQIEENFEYDNKPYEYDITQCTRDKLNRPIAHYYEGNPKQQIFDYNKTNQKIVIGSEDLTMKDYSVLIASKVIRDIFQDDEVMNYLLIILVAVALLGIANIIVTVTHNTETVGLVGDNETIRIIAEGVRVAIQQGAT